MQELWNCTGPFLSGSIVGVTIGFIAGISTWIVLGLWRGTPWDRADIENELRVRYGLPRIGEEQDRIDALRRIADEKHLKMLLDDDAASRSLI